MALRQARSFCRICSGNCGMVLTIDETERIVGITGDKEQPMTKGYVCWKGLQAEEAHHGPSRLLQPQKRLAHQFVTVASEHALDDIGTRIGALVERYGPKSVALFNGTQGMSVATYQLNTAFMAAIGSSQLFSTLTIDQSAKIVSFERQGGWAAGLQDLSQSEVILFFGANPVLSHITVPVMGPDPARRLKAAKARGLKLICIDPRRSETAYHADLFLQPLPGRDAAIAAALIRVILTEGWNDEAFTATYVGADRMLQLRLAVEPFTPEFVEHCAGLTPGQIRAAAQLFARDCRTGAAYASTGPSMAPFSNLMQHFVDGLNIICGRFRRAGDRAVVDMVAAERFVHAEVIGPPRSWQAVSPSRIRGVGCLGGEKLSSTLAEEILTPGADQIRCLIVAGGNPAATVPDQRRIVEALQSLDLLVVIDPWLTATAQLAHYVLPPRMQYERADLPVSVPGFPLYPDSWGQYAPAALTPPPGSDVVEEWYVFWALARRLGVQIVYNGVALDMSRTPTAEELFAIRLAAAPVTFDELKQYPSGKVFDHPTAIVQAARPEATARFDVMPADVADETTRLHAWLQREGAGPGAGFTHLLSTRRMRDVHNSTGNRLDSTLGRIPVNPAYMHSTELAALGLEAGDRIQIASGHGAIDAVAQADDHLRRGIVSIAHAWGMLPGDSGPGVNVNLLISCDTELEPLNAMPRMSAIPVTVRPLSRSRAEASIESESKELEHVN